jgi:hypothetical protein
VVFLNWSHFYAFILSFRGSYETILRPQVSRQDVAFAINNELVRRGFGKNYVAINCAVEESKVSSRDGRCLLSHDAFIRDNITEDDIVVVSVGGNDIALTLNPCTICNMLGLICCTTGTCVKNCSCGCDLPCVCPFIPCCTGSSWIGCLSNVLAWPCGLGYFIHLFKTKIRDYILTMLGRRRPRAVAICMIYYPSEEQNGSWADRVLGALGYNQNPRKLQSVIDAVFRLATEEIKIPGTTVIPVPLFEALNGKIYGDYVQRVEPSASGGVKMANLILDLLNPVILSPIRTEVHVSGVLPIPRVAVDHDS